MHSSLHSTLLNLQSHTSHNNHIPITHPQETHFHTTHQPSTLTMYPNTLLPSLLLLLLLPLTLSAPTLPTCPCSKIQPPPVNICAKPAGDIAWCTFRLCAQGYHCVDEAWATHTCTKHQTKGVHICLRNKLGMVIKPRPHENTRCKCVYIKDRIVTHINPIL